MHHPSKAMLFFSPSAAILVLVVLLQVSSCFLVVVHSSPATAMQKSMKKSIIAKQRNSNKTDTEREAEPYLTYWHNWSDKAGVSHLTRCQLTHFVSIKPIPGLHTDIKTNATQIVFVDLDPSYVGPWHKDPAPQFVSFLQGIGEWTTMDGTSRNFTLGDLYFGNDQLSTKGHLSRTVGDTPLKLMMVQFPQALATGQYEPCWMK